MGRTYWWNNSSGRIELEFTEEQIENQPKSGNCAPSVKQTTPQLESQFSEYPPQLLKEEAIEMGCNDYGNDGEPTLEHAKEFITWVAIGDLQENGGE